MQTDATSVAKALVDICVKNNHKITLARLQYLLYIAQCERARANKPALFDEMFLVDGYPQLESVNELYEMWGTTPIWNTEDNLEIDTKLYRYLEKIEKRFAYIPNSELLEYLTFRNNVIAQDDGYIGYNTLCSAEQATRGNWVQERKRSLSIALGMEGEF